jgi:hypothetical protein
MDQTSPLFHEQRLEQRRITAIAAVIVFDAARQRLPCIIRNISSRGAKLQVFSLSQIPLTFNLLLDGELVPCRMVWRSLKELGVVFDPR